VNIIRRKGIALDAVPTLLYGYGGYGISETPYFLGAARRVFSTPAVSSRSRTSAVAASLAVA
jgi:hypothetical protein